MPGAGAQVRKITEEHRAKKFSRRENVLYAYTYRQVNAEFLHSSLGNTASEDVYNDTRISGTKWPRYSDYHREKHSRRILIARKYLIK